MLRRSCSNKVRYVHQALGSHLLHVDLKWTLRLTLGTGARLHLLVLGLEKGPQHKVTLVAVVLDHSELGENTGAAAYDTAGPNQLVQMELPEKNEEMFQSPPALSFPS